MRVDPPKHLKPFIKSYNILEYNFSKEEIKTSDIYIPAWTKNFFLFFCKDIWDVELSNGKYLTGYDTMFTGCMTYGLRYIRKNPNAYIIAIELQPETLYHILKKDISFMTNNSVYAEKIIPKSGEILIQLKEEKKTKDRIEILNHFLSQVFQKIEYIENIYIRKFFDEYEDKFIKKGEDFSLKKLIENLDISERHYRRLFEKIIGIAPKLYYRIKKLEYTLLELHNNPEEKYLNILRGYSDQSHFIRDFMRFMGKKPTELQNYFKDIQLKKVYNYL